MQDHDLVGADQLGDVRETTAAERRAAALTVCQHAEDADDAARLLDMLGLVGPSTHRLAVLCRECGRAMSNLAGVGHVKQAGDGMCSSCHPGAVNAS